MRECHSLIFITQMLAVIGTVVLFLRCRGIGVRHPFPNATLIAASVLFAGISILHANVDQ